MTQKEEIREGLHRIIDQVDDEKILEAVYTILQKEVLDSTNFQFDEDLKTEIDKRSERHKNEESKSYNWDQAKQKIRFVI